MVFDAANLPYWIFLITGVVLYVFVIVSGGADEDADVDIEVGADISGGDSDFDLDNPLDLDTDADEDFNVGQLLGWLGFGRAPLILLLATDLSLWGLFGWMLNVFVGNLLGQIPSGVLAGPILFASLLGALFLGSLIARPIGQAFAAFGEDASSDRLIGCVGTVTSVKVPAASEGKIGQVDVWDASRNLITVSALLPEWATVSPKRGDKIWVIDRQPQGYLVIAKDSPDQDTWLDQSPRDRKFKDLNNSNSG